MPELEDGEPRHSASTNPLPPGLRPLHSDLPSPFPTVIGRPIGLSERAALVEALRREFPEIFEII